LASFAHIAVSKYCDGLPLFRQSVILAREGVEIDRATLADWIGRAAWWLAPLARLVGTTLQYALGRWEALTRYAEDGRLAIDNNVAERLMRGIAVTRKNFLFLGSDAGGDRAAILYTLIETAKLNGLNPEAYLAYTINQLAHGHLASRLSELLPWNCKNAAEACSV